MDGLATGPGPPFPRRPEIMDVKRGAQLSRKNLGECRSGTENDQPNARTRELVASTRLVVHMSPQTMVAASMRDVEQQLQTKFLRTVGGELCAKKTTFPTNQ